MVYFCFATKEFPVALQYLSIHPPPSVISSVAPALARHNNNNWCNKNPVWAREKACVRRWLIKISSRQQRDRYDIGEGSMNGYFCPPQIPSCFRFPANGNRANLLVDVLVDKALKFGVNDPIRSYCLGSCLTVWTCAVRFRFYCSIKIVYSPQKAQR